MATAFHLRHRAATVFEFLPVHDDAGGVGRIAENDGLGAIIEGPGEFVEIDAPIGRADGDEPRRGAGEDAIGPVIFVKRLVRMTSSPGLIRAVRATIMASVAPQTTVSCVSGSTVSP